MRLYLPATLELLEQWYADGAVPSAEEAFEAPDDTEEGEYAALMSAADVSAELGGRGGRRVVLVVEGAAAPYPVSAWASVHADAVDRADDADPDDDLAWFAIQEIGDLR